MTSRTHVPDMQHHFYRKDWGWHYVKYSNGQTSMLMKHRDALTIALTHNATVMAHPQRPKWWQVWRQPTMLIRPQAPVVQHTQWAPHFGRQKHPAL